MLPTRKHLIVGRKTRNFTLEIDGASKHTNLHTEDGSYQGIVKRFQTHRVMAQNQMDLLHAFRKAQARYGILVLNTPWTVEIGRATGSMQLVVVESNDSVLRINDGEDRKLKAGDIVMVSPNWDGVVSSKDSSEALDLNSLWDRHSGTECAVVRAGGTGGRSVFICRVAALEHPVAKKLLGCLPPVIHPEKSRVGVDWIDLTLSRMAQELNQSEYGGHVVATYLTDALLVEAIRGWLNRNPHVLKDGNNVVLDRRIALAVDLIHRQPEQEWSLESLAKAVGMSRSVFAEHFAASVGQPAMRYLATLRMTLALSRLKDGADSVGVIGRHLGYTSEAAFSRAFRRYVGLSPSAVRRVRERHDEALITNQP